MGGYISLRLSVMLAKRKHLKNERTSEALLCGICSYINNVRFSYDKHGRATQRKFQTFIQFSNKCFISVVFLWSRFKVCAPVTYSDFMNIEYYQFVSENCYCVFWWYSFVLTFSSFVGFFRLFKHRKEIHQS